MKTLLYQQIASDTIQEERTPYIRVELNELEAVIGELENNLNKLVNRINSVLMPDITAPQKVGDKEPEPTLPELAMIIRKHRQFLQNLSNVTRDITNRIEL